jgi:hypothetical protein
MLAIARAKTSSTFESITVTNISNVYHQGTEANSCLEQYRDAVEGIPGRMTKEQGRSEHMTVLLMSHMQQTN